MAKILIIDDDSSIREVIRGTLTHFGHTVVEAHDGKKGLALFASAQPDLLITDIVMPEMEGIAVLIELRKIEAKVKIIAISGGGRQTAVDYLYMAKLLGAHKILSKPFTFEDLIEAVDELLGG